MTDPIVVRLFSDYAGSVIWAPDPIDYADLGLDAELTEELRAWDAAYDAGLDDDEWKDPAAHAAHTAEARRLGRRLAGVLGDEFVIRTDGGEFRSPHPARSPAAAAVLRRIDDEIRARRQELERLRDGGAGLEWRS